MFLKRILLQNEQEIRIFKMEFSFNISNYRNSDLYSREFLRESGHIIPSKPFARSMARWRIASCGRIALSHRLRSLQINSDAS